VTPPLRCCVLIPALNEERAIRAIVEGALSYAADVIVIDDGSTDRTAERVADLPITLIRHETPGGKGNALRVGFREALTRDVDGVLTMDGDGQHASADIPRLLAAARRMPGHFIFGARIIGRERQPTYRRLANEFADWGIAWAVGQRLIDSQSGQRFYPRDVVELALKIAPQGFVFEADILIEAARQLGTRIAAVPIESRYSSEFRASHFKPLRDFYRITSHVVGRALERSELAARCRSTRKTPITLLDPPIDDAGVGNAAGIAGPLSS
jgi:glycosyltransferase involved in cell wall biosynthesis